MDAAQIKNRLTREKVRLAREYGVASLGLFGSLTRGEFRQGSDIDILVEFDRPIGLLKFLQLEDHLSDLLGARVDLVTKKALKPAIGRHILREVVPL